MIVFDEITTGAQNDLQRATEIARSMVTLYGMTENLGSVTYEQTPSPFLQQSLYPQQREISDETAKLIDLEIRSIIDNRMKGVLKTLKDHEATLHKVAKRLLEKETLESEEFVELVGKIENEESKTPKTGTIAADMTGT